MTDLFLIPDEVLLIMDMLHMDGHKAFVVGGAVRDELLGLDPKDYVIATSAMPDEIIETFASADHDVKDIDAASYHIVNVNGYEVATFRHDIYANEETISTVPVKTLEADLARRDLTINAMAISRDLELIDPYGGRQDLLDKKIRFVGSASRRIMEDPCRIIRAARFKALLDGRFDRQDARELREHNKLVSEVPSERIRAEILKTMKYNKPSEFFYALKEIEILHAIFPSLNKTWGADGGPYHAETVFEHSMWTGDNLGDVDPMLRLVGYLHDIGKTEPNFVEGVIHFYYHHDIGAEMVVGDLKALKFTNNEIKYAVNLIATHMRGGIKMSPKTTRKLLSKFVELGIDWEDWLALKVADRASNALREPFSQKQVNKIRRKFEHELNPEPRDITGFARTALEHKDLAISGTRIQEMLGIGPSQLVGVILQFLLDRVIADPSLNTNEQLEKLIMGKKKPVDFTAREYHDSLQ